REAEEGLAFAETRGVGRVVGEELDAERGVGRAVERADDGRVAPATAGRRDGWETLRIVRCAVQVDAQSGVGKDAVAKERVATRVWETKPKTGIAANDAHRVEGDAIPRASGHAANDVVVGAVRKYDAVARVAKGRDAVGLRADKVALNQVSGRVADAIGRRHKNAIERRVPRDDISRCGCRAAHGVVG